MRVDAAVAFVAHADRGDAPALGVQLDHAVPQANLAAPGLHARRGYFPHLARGRTSGYRKRSMRLVSTFFWRVSPQ